MLKEHDVALMRSGVIGQVMRFGIAGIVLTGITAGGYLGFIKIIGVSPGISIVLATIVATVCGFFVHGTFSFRHHGNRDQVKRRFARFAITNLFGLFLNYLYVFVLVDLLKLPTWSPVPLFFVATPALTFWMNRTWVFK